MRLPGGGYQPEGSTRRPPRNPPNQGSSGVPPAPPAPGSPAFHQLMNRLRCPTCGRAYEPPGGASFRFDWALLASAVIVATAVTFGALVYVLYLMVTS